MPLTLSEDDGYESLMKKRLRLILKGHANHDVAVLAYKGKKLVGWTLTFDIEFEEPKFMVFVHPKHRFKGIGRKLTEKTLRYLKKRKEQKEIFIAPWDNISAKFYSAIDKFEHGSPVKKRNNCFVQKKEL